MVVRLLRIVALVALAVAVTTAASPKRLLVVTVTKGFRHDSIPTAERVIARLGATSGSFTVDFARTDEELLARTTAKALEAYDGVLFAHTTGDLPLADRAAFLKWIEAGHGFVGIHSASDTFHGFTPYVQMVGGEFDSHGEQATVRVLVEDASHPATRGLDRSFTTHDEIYLFKNFERSRVRMLLALDRHPNTSEAGYFPLAWHRDHGRGRVIYTALGHREDVLESEWFGRHLLGAICWAVRE